MKVARSDDGSLERLDVLFVDGRLFAPHLNYVVDMRIGPSSNVKAIQAISLLLEYIEANHASFSTANKLFGAFVRSLHEGTIDERGLDASRLYWHPRGAKTANGIVEALNKFSDYCSVMSDGVEPLNPWRKATLPEEQMAWAAWHHKRDKSFLKHTMSSSAARHYVERKRQYASKESPYVDANSGVKSFPEARLEDLILNGFIIPGKQDDTSFYKSHNLRDILIVLLMNAGGLRISEVFHLYVTDVVEDPKKPDVAFVRIFHPCEGLAPEPVVDVKTGSKRNLVRSEYLNRKYKLTSRNKLPSGDRYHAGWKSLMLDNPKTKSVNVKWFPLEAGRLFWSLWKEYLIQRALLPNSHSHPFAFVGNNGQMYSINGFNRNYQAACKRIGLPVSQSFGTNPHGHRHAYGQRLSTSKASQMVIKKAMHHKSLDSQGVYTAPTNQRVEEELQLLHRRLEAEKKGQAIEEEDQSMMEALNNSNALTFEFNTLGWNPER